MTKNQGAVRIEWRESFELGIPAIDHEHREMVERLNGAFAAIEAGGAQEEILGRLGEIYTWISAHFALEETIMRERRYDQLGDHKQDHERLLDDIRGIMDECAKGRAPAIDRTLAGRLEAWFTEHFKTRDARLHKNLTDR
jgi:hemerythrin-like metal-binding protein